MCPYDVIDCPVEVFP